MQTSSYSISKIAKNLKKDILSSFPSLKNFLSVKGRINLGDARISVDVYDLDPKTCETIESIFDLWKIDQALKISLFNRKSDHAIEMLHKYCEIFHPEELDSIDETLFKSQLFHGSQEFWEWFNKIEEPI